MVNANELRIGNWVQTNHNGKNKQGTIIEITNHHIHLIAVNKVGGVLDLMEYLIEPIPLTPEILEKCGFWSHMDGGYYLPEDPNDKDNLMPKSGFIFNEEMDYHYEDHYAHRSIKIESVHQLQNLYFAMTGEELTVNL